ncbi:hypothetical protein HK104_007755, partial [Borealophlyctis nickersoniae]
MSRNNLTLHTLTSQREILQLALIAELKNLQRKIQELEERLAELSTNQVIAELKNLQRRIQDLEEPLAEALLGGATKPSTNQVIAELKSLQRKIQELEEQLAEALLGGGTKDKETEWELEFWKNFEKEWKNDMSSTSDTAPQHSNSTVANTGSCCVPTIRKRSNPTVANEKSKKEPKNESETETELELEFDVEKEWDDMGGVT